MKDSKQQEIYTLCWSIRYQYPTGATTMGDCSNKCGDSARGAKVCADCLVEELAELTTVNFAYAYRRYIKNSAIAAGHAIELLEDYVEHEDE